MGTHKLQVPYQGKDRTIQCVFARGALVSETPLKKYPYQKDP